MGLVTTAPAPMVAYSPMEVWLRIDDYKLETMEPFLDSFVLRLNLRLKTKLLPSKRPEHPSSHAIGQQELDDQPMDIVNRKTALATPKRSPSNHPHITNAILKLRIGVPGVCQDLPFHPFVIDSKCIKLGAALPTLIAVEIDG